MHPISICKRMPEKTNKTVLSNSYSQCVVDNLLKTRFAYYFCDYLTHNPNQLSITRPEGYLCSSWEDISTAWTAVTHGGSLLAKDHFDTRFIGTLRAVSDWWQHTKSSHVLLEENLFGTYRNPVIECLRVPCQVPITLGNCVTLHSKCIDKTKVAYTWEPFIRKHSPPKDIQQLLSAVQIFVSSNKAHLAHIQSLDLCWIINYRRLFVVDCVVSDSPRHVI